ncbi:MAG: hypothetical protein ACLFWH_05680 [Actinomycetota bacterium]
MFAPRSSAADIDWSDRDAVVRYKLRVLEDRIDHLYIALILFLFVLTAVLMVAFSVIR